MKKIILWAIYTFVVIGVIHSLAWAFSGFENTTALSLVSVAIGYFASEIALIKIGFYKQ
jgi:hypothetical protein